MIERREKVIRSKRGITFPSASYRAASARTTYLIFERRQLNAAPRNSPLIRLPVCLIIAGPSREGKKGEPSAILGENSGGKRSGKGSPREEERAARKRRAVPRRDCFLTLIHCLLLELITALRLLTILPANTSAQLKVEGFLAESCSWLRVLRLLDFSRSFRMFCFSH